MGWIKLDDGFFRNPKIVSVGRDARDLYLAGLCYCGANLTDGIIPKNAVKIIAAEAEIRLRLILISQLIGVGLWTEVDGNYHVHDYLNHQISKEKVLSNREIRAIAGKQGGLQKASKMLANSQQNPSKTLANGLAKTYQSKSKSKNTSPNGLDDAQKTDDDSPDEMDESPKPFDLLSALCDEIDQDVSILTEKEKSKQLAVAKRLIREGVTDENIRAITRWLMSQDWVTGGVDMLLIEKQLGKWQLAGKPDRVTKRRRTAADHNSAAPGKFVQ
jgi:hypothetical protein